MKTLALVISLSFAITAPAATPEMAARAVNTLGLNLHRQMPLDGNTCLSPYSIQSALAMTYLGASGVTQKEMEQVLHFPADKTALSESFAALAQALQEAQEASARLVAGSKKYGGPTEAVKLHVANRLFGQKGYEFRDTFRSSVKQHFGAPMELMNFIKDHADATREINEWVEKQTQKRIRDLIPDNGLNETTRLVLVNALYFKSAWMDEFSAQATTPKPFHPSGGKQTVEVPTMFKKTHMRYHRGNGFQTVALPYAGNQLHFLLIVPDDVKGVTDVETKLTPEVLLACSGADSREVILHLPKFKITPPTMLLGDVLQKMGMTTAFDKPQGSADFDAMAPKKPDDYLYISAVFHKTFLELDEKGTEAAAATAVVMVRATGIAPPPEKPIEINADRPFLFAIQHAASGACLFLGRVSDPR